MAGELQLVVNRQLDLRLDVPVYYVRDGDTIAHASLDEAEAAAFNGMADDLQEHINPEHYVNELTYTTVTIRDRDGNEQEMSHWTRNEYGEPEVDYDDFIENVYANVSDIGTFINRGSYGFVFNYQPDEKYVVKIGAGRELNGDVLEDGWIPFAAFCMKHNKRGEYPILPRVKHLRVFGNLYIALVERMEVELNGYDNKASIQPQVVGLKKGLNEYNAWWKPPEGIIPDPYYEKMGAELAAHPEFPDTGDLHDGNIMVSFDGRIVITDPSSSHSTENLEELLTQLGVMAA